MWGAHKINGFVLSNKRLMIASRPWEVKIGYTITNVWRCGGSKDVSSIEMNEYVSILILMCVS